MKQTPKAAPAAVACKAQYSTPYGFFLKRPCRRMRKNHAPRPRKHAKAALARIGLARGGFFPRFCHKISPCRGKPTVLPLYDASFTFRSQQFIVLKSWGGLLRTRFKKLSKKFLVSQMSIRLVLAAPLYLPIFEEKPYAYYYCWRRVSFHLIPRPPGFSLER